MADANPAQRRRARPGRTRGLHSRARVLRKCARILRHRQPLPAHRPRRSSSRPCSRRTATGPAGAFRMSRKPSDARSSRRAPSGSTTARATFCRPGQCSWRAWAPSCSSTTWSATPTASRSRRPSPTARAAAHDPILTRGCSSVSVRNSSLQFDSRTADVERGPRAGLPQRAARRRSRAHRRHRGQRRRHTDLPAGRDRRSAGGRISRRHGLDAHAGRLHVRERRLPPHRHGQRRTGGPVRAQATRT